MYMCIYMYVYTYVYMCVCIYIYMYIHCQSKVFGHPKKVLFLILKVLFLMKQVKHHNVFIYYT